ncbi:MAG: DUF465 domain-containing protein [Terriglobia bacterium]
MDGNSQEDIKAHLETTNEQFRELLLKHHEYDRLVDALESKNAPSAEDEIEEHRLKKLKLHLKDQMEQMVSEYKFANAGG